ncbi:Putative protein phosphatase 2C-type [Pirellulimonas nuda]|uniref:PPM-type phosphatase domain-containing protein n=1 Tax=Pirellulimonas nuda TaxID=2528009 RepID=A0A518DHU3_9BACT|nr:protein phosphatase 2C domain-containing protein [Pirellulimonas nuda]QDU91045.1 Putative protein phosphatase 2C-type [Pirellulimonas nuda]
MDVTQDALLVQAWQGDTAPRSVELIDARMDRPCVLGSKTGQAALFSCRSPAKETSNEDSSAAIEPWPGALVLIVADGLGGHASGDAASRIAVETLVAAVRSIAVPDEPSLRAALLDGIERAHDAIFALGTGGATTLAVAEIVDQVARTFHVGDSVVLIFGQRGKRKLETVAHSPVGYAIEAGYLDANDAMSHEDRHLISNCVGRPGMRIEVGAPVTLSRFDTLLVASDGLVDNLQVDEVVEMLRKGAIGKSVETVARLTLDRMRAEVGPAPSKPDDLTIAVFRPAGDGGDGK